MNKIEKEILETVLKPCSEGGEGIRFPLDDGTPEGTHINLAGIIQAARQIGWREGLTAASSRILHGKYGDRDRLGPCGERDEWMK